MKCALREQNGSWKKTVWKLERNLKEAGRELEGSWKEDNGFWKGAARKQEARWKGADRKLEGC